MARGHAPLERVRVAEEETAVKGPIIEVLVGKEELFTVHESLLRPSSPFFDRMLSGNWKEASERRVELPEDDPKIFAIYVCWLYQQQIPTIRKRRRAGSTEFLRLVQAYILGDKIQAKAFQNKIIDAIVEKNRDNAGKGLLWFREIPDYDCVSLTYESTLPGSPLRKLLVELWALAGEERIDNTLPPEFLQDLVMKLLPNAKTQLVRSIQSSHFHLRLDKK